MVSAAPYGQGNDLSWLLTNFGKQVPNVTSVLVASADGLKKHFHGLDEDGAERLAAIASGLFSLARSAGVAFRRSPGVRQVIAELEDQFLFVTTAGEGALLAVTAERNPTVDVALIGYEMGQLVKSVQPHLATARRSAVLQRGDAVR